MARLPPLLLLIALCLLITIAPARSEPVVWVAPSLVRVGPEDPPKDQKQIALYSAKGECESFQIVVRAPTGGLTNVNVTGSLPGAKVTLYREHYVFVGDSSPNPPGNGNRPLGAGWYPDGLIPFADAAGRDLRGAELDAVPFRLAAARNAVVWVDVYTPRDAKAGEHRGVFTVSSDKGRATLPVTLHVWDFALPVKPALKSCFLFWPKEQDGAGRNVTQQDEELLRHRLMPISVDPANERRFIDTLGLNCTNAGFWSGADLKASAMRAAPSVAECQQAAARHQRDLFLYNYTADEIGPNPKLHAPMQTWARNLHAAGIRNLVTMAPIPELYADGSTSRRSAVDAWVVLPKTYDTARDRIAHVLGKGDEVWSYNAVVQDTYSPKWELDFAPINYRIQPGFISQSLSLTGLLYWRVDHWSRDPWDDVNAYPGYPGEGLLVYPGRQVGVPGVVPSMRLKYLRDGVDDYDYVALLKRKGQGEWALGVAREVGADWSGWTRDSAALEAARRRLGERLSRR